MIVQDSSEVLKSLRCQIFKAAPLKCPFATDTIFLNKAPAEKQQAIVVNTTKLLSYLWRD